MAFKSTSRRGSAAEAKAIPLPAAASRRRSHSVSAVSRKPIDGNILNSTEFSNRRDNPLFWTSSSSPPEREECVKPGEVASTDNKQSNSLRRSKNCCGSSNSIIEQRGRSITRSSGISCVKNGIGRSLSRTRGRSVSRAVVRGGGHENGKEQHMAATNARSTFDTRGNPENAVLSMVENQSIEWSEIDSACSLRMSNVDDEISTGSLTEAEEKPCKSTVRAFQRNNYNNIISAGVADVPPNLADSGDTELISDMREFSIKLREFEDRARKLRVDLAIEEQRRQELDRLLSEILRDPKTSALKSHPGRRTTSERKRMEKHLSQEAMTYFDECVSLSTFDSSDFSASEDPVCSSAGVTLSAGASSLIEGGPSTLCCYDQNSGLQQKQLRHDFEDSGITNKFSCVGQQYQFSFANQQSPICGSHEDLKSCIKQFGRANEKDESNHVDSFYDADIYVMHSHIESLLVDRVLYKSRIDSGGLHLCNGVISFLPFSSLV